MRFLITTDTVGGVWTYTRELVSGLLEVEGHAVCLVTVGPLPSAAQLASLRARQRETSNFQFECMEGCLEWQSENAEAYSRFEAPLLRLLQHFRPDVVHSNQFCFGALPVSCPKVVVAHSDVLSWHKAVRGSEAEDSAWLRQYIALVRAGLAGATAVVAPTKTMQHDLETGFGTHPRSLVISNGREISAERAHRKLQAIAAGRVWDAAKGMDVFEDLYSPMPILIAGDTTNRDGSYDASRLRRCVLLGLLPEETLLSLFAESSVYIATSVYEPFGLGPVEAALCGCAVLARDIPTFREVWGDAATYFHSRDTLREALKAFAKDEVHLTRARKASYRRAKSRYSRHAMTEAYLQLYGELTRGTSYAKAASPHA